MRTTQLLNLDQLLIEMEVITKENQLSLKEEWDPMMALLYQKYH